MKLHHIHIDYITLQAERTYLIKAKLVMLKCRVYSSTTSPIATVHIFVC
jgi:hypothetical protein